MKQKSGQHSVEGVSWVLRSTKSGSDWGKIIDRLDDRSTRHHLDRSSKSGRPSFDERRVGLNNLMRCHALEAEELLA